MSGGDGAGAHAEEGDLPWVSVAELADRAGAELLDATAAIQEPLLAVHLDASEPAVVTAAVQAAAATDRIVIGVATTKALDPELDPLVAALDLTLVPSGSATRSDRVGVADPIAEVAELRRRVAANPQAATVLAGVLRWSGRLGVPDALDAESFAYSTLLGGAEFHQWMRRRGPRAAPPAVAAPVLVARDGDQLRITLNRPERRNAYGRQLRDELVAALELAVLDEGITRVILEGAGPSFCAGGDLAEFGTAPDPVVAHLVRTRAGAGRLVHRLADRLEVHVHGPCVGAGIELPAFAGRLVAREDATFRLPEIGMGLIPGAGGTVSIPRRIGRWRTLHLALTGRPIDAATALDRGLVDAVER